MSPNFIVFFAQFQSGDLDVPDSPAASVTEVAPTWSESLDRQLSDVVARASVLGWNHASRPFRAGDYVLSPHRQLYRLDRAGTIHLMKGAKCGDCLSRALLPKLVRDWWQDRPAAVAECLYCGSCGPRTVIRGEEEADLRRACLTAVWRTSRR